MRNAHDSIRRVASGHAIVTQTVIGTMFAEIINRHIHAGQELWTPGRGIPPRGQSPFKVAAVDDARMIFEFPPGESCVLVRLSAIEDAIIQTRNVGGTVRLGGSQGWAEPGTFHRFLQDAKGSPMRIVTYVAPVVVECELAEYTMIGRSKGLRLTT